MKTKNKILKWLFVAILMAAPFVAWAQLVGTHGVNEDYWFRGRKAVKFGNNPQMKIYHDGTNGVIDVTSGTVVFPHGISATITGTAATATALAADPTDCAANQFATSIVANGNLGCTALNDTSVPDAITISGGTVNNSIIGAVTPAAGTFTALVSTGEITSSGASLGWTIQNAANQECTTTCVSAAVFGWDTTSGEVAVGPADATADKCLCAGPN